MLSFYLDLGGAGGVRGPKPAGFKSLWGRLPSHNWMVSAIETQSAPVAGSKRPWLWGEKPQTCRVLDIAVSRLTIALGSVVPQIGRWSGFRGYLLKHAP